MLFNIKSMFRDSEKKTHESSLGRNADRTKPVPSCAGFPRPELSSVSVALVVSRIHVYGISLTEPLEAYVPMSRASVVAMTVLIAETHWKFLKNSMSFVAS